MTEFKVIEEDTASEPYEYYDSWKTVEVTGELAVAILARVDKTVGEVTITERFDSWGTCDICGGEDEYFLVFVDGEQVFRGESVVGFEKISVFSAFPEWVN